jgi:ADP-ribose pyrophosphatase
MFKEDTIDLKIHFKGRVFSVEEHQVILHDGQRAKREIVRHSGGACVVPVDDDGNVYLVNQFRKPYDRMLLEIPAGKLEPGEDPLECASRELTEETGLTAQKIQMLATVYPSPGYCDEILTIFIATGLNQGVSNPDQGEFLTVQKLAIADAIKMIELGQIPDGKTQIGLLRAERWLLNEMSINRFGGEAKN